MKCAVLHGVKNMTIEEREIPKPVHGQVLIKVMACGVCGTDVHIFEGDKGATDNPLPIVLGHEFSGIVEEVGSGADDFKPGDRVCVDPNVLCGHCHYCLSGIGHFCEHMIGIGTTINGGFSQYCIVPVQAVYRLGDGLSFAEGAMGEPLSCCIHGIDMCNIIPGDDVVVIGGGMIGLLMVQLAKLYGAARVVLAEPVESKREVAKKLGADLCVDPVASDLKTELVNSGIIRAAAVIECVGKASTIQQAIDIAGKKSVVMMFGLTQPDSKIELQPFEIFRREIEIKSSYINPYTMGRAVSLLNQKKVDVSSMVAGRIPLEHLADVLGSAALRSKGKYIVEPWA